jgi:hypothetical protein
MVMKKSLSALIALALITGCASSNSSEGMKAAEGLDETRSGLAKAQSDVDQVLTALNNLGRRSANATSADEDLRASYNTYVIAYNNLQETALAARKRARAMKDNSEQYMQTWEREAATISDSAMKSASEKRREAVRAHYDNVKEAADAVREAYGPLLTSLTDIKKTLDVDLSAAALPAIAPAKEKANQQGQTLKQRLSALIGELDKIQSAT